MLSLPSCSSPVRLWLRSCDQHASSPDPVDVGLRRRVGKPVPFNRQLERRLSITLLGSEQQNPVGQKADHSRDHPRPTAIQPAFRGLLPRKYCLQARWILRQTLRAVAADQVEGALVERAVTSAMAERTSLSFQS